MGEQDTPISRSRPLTVPSGRVARIARLGSMATRVAGSMAASGLRELASGKRPEMRDLLLTPGNIRRVADDLARMRGAAMKVGQLVSMDSGEMLPPELAEIMARLRADADYMPPRQIKQVLTQSWGADWLRRFKRFDVRPIAAASIGQVHRAQTRDGRDMAIKLQYPGVARSIDSDVANIGTLLGLSGLVPPGFELGPYLDEAKRQLHEEADYAREGRCLQRFRALLAGQEAFALPELYEDFSTPTILAMSYLPARPIEAALELDAAARDRIALEILTLTFRELFEFGLMQTDPNFANYRFDPDTGQVVLLDFGATRSFAPSVVAQYRRLLRAGLAADRAALAQTAQDIGFLTPDLAERHRGAILGMIDTVFARVRAAELFDFADPSLNREMHAAGMALAEDGFVPPPVPMDVLYIQRKLAGSFLLAARLRARLPLAAVIEKATAQGLGEG